MARVGCFGIACVCALSTVVSACGNPPDKELQQAQATLDAARASGADRYAHEQLVAAEQALARAREAVEQRDYRLALNNALDSRERAQSAAMAAAANKAKARDDADKALADATALVNAAGARLKTPGRTHGSGRALAALRRATADADAAVQKARTSFDSDDYEEAVKTVSASTAKLRAALRDVESAAAPAPRRRR